MFELPADELFGAIELDTAASSDQTDQETRPRAMGKDGMGRSPSDANPVCDVLTVYPYAVCLRKPLTAEQLRITARDMLHNNAVRVRQIETEVK